MNQHEAERIAAAMNQLRPDWPRRSLLTLIEKSLMDRPRRDVIVALGWVAAEPGTSTPARVLESGPWWLAAAVDGQTTGLREPYDPNRFCGICNKPEHRCRANRFADHDFESATDHARRLSDAPPKPRLPRVKTAPTEEEA